MQWSNNIHPINKLTSATLSSPYFEKYKHTYTKLWKNYKNVANCLVGSKDINKKSGIMCERARQRACVYMGVRDANQVTNASSEWERKTRSRDTYLAFRAAFPSSHIFRPLPPLLFSNPCFCVTACQTCRLDGVAKSKRQTESWACGGQIQADRNETRRNDDDSNLIVVETMWRNSTRSENTHRRAVLRSFFSNEQIWRRQIITLFYRSFWSSNICKKFWQ